MCPECYHAEFVHQKGTDQICCTRCFAVYRPEDDLLLDEDDKFRILPEDPVEKAIVIFATLASIAVFLYAIGPGPLWY